MNVFEKSITGIEVFIEGYNLLQQAGLPIEARFSFEFEEQGAMEAAFKGEKAFISPTFSVPMWFVRAMRKHGGNVYSWNYHGHTKEAWISRNNNGIIKVKSWELGGRAFWAEVVIRTQCGLVFFTTRKQGE